MNLTYLTTYFIAGTQDLPTSRRTAQDLLELLEQALKAGITCFQLREKGEHALQRAKDINTLAHNCKALCKQYQVPFFVNDNVKLALDVAADGVHVGQDDMPIADVINYCDKQFMIGLSINTLEQALAAKNISAIDYLGVGPIFATASKADATATVGTALIEQIRKSGIKKPIVGIGGINTQNASAVRQAGANGVAVISAITQAKDYTSCVQELLNAEAIYKSLTSPL